MNISLIVLVALAIFFMTPLARLMIAALFGTAIGRVAVSRQPDTIHLEPTDTGKLRNGAYVDSIASAFRREGFESAGLYQIPEMPGVCVQLLAHRRDSMVATIYDHPAAGVFYGVVSRYDDGGSCTHTTAKATGIRNRPDTCIVNLPGAEPGTLVQRARSERNPHGLRACSTSTAAPDFVAAYAEYMAWMKQHAFTSSEMVDVARRKAA